MGYSGSEHEAGQNVPWHSNRFAARPNGLLGELISWKIVGASWVFAAAYTCARHGPLAWVGGEFDVTQVVGFVPHQQGSGSPPCVHVFLLARKQA